METLLEVKDLYVEYRTGSIVSKAVNGVNLKLRKGEALGLVGESGAGKTTIALSILNLLPDKIGFITKGSVIYNGINILGLKEKRLEDIRGNDISMIFQNPLTSLNPLFTVGEQISMVARKHKKMNRKEANELAKEILETVGIRGDRLDEYPHEFSGGMRQRVGIAASLICSPSLLIADEPTTALDVTIQAQILELMKDLQMKYASSLIMITHNLGIISELCQNVAVIYAGRIFEYGAVSSVFQDPTHWYTKGLMNAIPKLKGEKERLVAIPGNVANSINLPTGCKFHPRCKYADEKCRKIEPDLQLIDENHYVACWHIRNGGKKIE